MTYAEAIKFLYSLRWFGAKFGLENTLKLAELAGNPQEKLRFIHVAGTNGKGSTCAMLESIYRSAGLRVGLFTSPHLVSFRERIQVNRELIGEEDVVRLVEELRKFVAAGVPPAVEPGFQPGGTGVATPERVEKITQSPGGRMPPFTAGGTPAATFFEFITVMALCYFAEQKCDLVIWETGLGGRLDATNIVTPLASVITNIGCDHQQWLGDTLERIAAEKAGIIKPGVPVLTATDEPHARAVIEAIAREKGATLTYVGQPRLSLTDRNKKMETGEAVLRLLGEHQQRNAALAVATVKTLQNKIKVSEEAIRSGLSSVQWPGRMQLVTTEDGRRILLDGAHNIDGARTLVTALKQNFSEQPSLILGILQDKNWREICAELAPHMSRILTVRVASERTADPEQLREACSQIRPDLRVYACTSLGEALDKVADEKFVLIAGSLYLLGEAMELLHLTETPGTNEKPLNEWTAKKT